MIILIERIPQRKINYFFQLLFNLLIFFNSSKTTSHEEDLYKTKPCARSLYENKMKNSQKYITVIQLPLVEYENKQNSKQQIQVESSKNHYSQWRRNRQRTKIKR